MLGLTGVSDRVISVGHGGRGCVVVEFLGA